MNTGLLAIQDFLQSYIHAISALLNVGVTVVDRNLVRIAGTAHYASQIGQKIEHGPFYRHLIQTGQPGVFKNAQNAEHCHQCDRQSHCSELADIAYPIFYEDEVLGIVGIIAFSEKEKAEMIRNGSNFKVFLQHMSSLIESKLVTLKQKNTLESQLDEAINASRKQLQEVGFIGQNQQIKEILGLSSRIASSDSTILITGESGTGKDVLARVIHEQSDRHHRLMIPVNCSAIPDTLIESELFGYEAGSFTGASKSGQPGKFELAHESTLFLDEIGEMSMHAQTKLLRVLQEKEVHRIGGKKGIAVDVRVICATNQDLWQLVKEKRFRMDLYYRINVIPMAIPPLRERRDDIPIFINKFINLYNKRLKKNIEVGSAEVLDCLVAYHWPGNVRELKNVIEYLVNIKQSGVIELSDLPSHFLVSQKRETSLELPLKELVAAHEKNILETLLANAYTTQEKQSVADRLGISLATLYRKMVEHHIK